MDSFMVVIAMATGIILLFVFPMMTMADRTDDVVLAAVKVDMKNFSDTVAVTGKLTSDEYSKFIESINATGNVYDVEMEIKVKDENPGKKAAQTASEKIGENVYYSMYTSQILELLGENNNGVIALKEGDYFLVNLKNKYPTLSEKLSNFVYKVTGNDNYNIAAAYVVMVSTNGVK